MDHAFGVVSKKSFLTPRPQRFSTMFSSRSCIILCFHNYVCDPFELIFVNGAKCGFWFWCFFCILPHHHLLKRLSFPLCQRCMAFALCLISVVSVCVVLFLGFLYCSIDFFVFMAKTTLRIAIAL